MALIRLGHSSILCTSGLARALSLSSPSWSSAYVRLDFESFSLQKTCARSVQVQRGRGTYSLPGDGSLPSEARSFSSELGASEGLPSTGPRRLILYSKPGCCLCDGLKEKLLTLRSHHSLYDISLEIRDITTNGEWEQAYQYEIPVLARVNVFGTEELLPRLSPRFTAEQVQKRVEIAFN